MSPETTLISCGGSSIDQRPQLRSHSGDAKILAQPTAAVKQGLEDQAGTAELRMIRTEGA
jgi:hypothetical protein